MRREFERLKRLQDRVISQVESFNAGHRLSRDAVHDREQLRREHDAMHLERTRKAAENDRPR